MEKQVLTMILPTENIGFKIIEMDNWVGKVFIVPRASIRDLKDQKGADKPAVYFLFGDNNEEGIQKLYIGETENSFNRLTDHDQNKDFWNIAVIFIGGVDKAKVKYLEYLAKKEAEEVNRFNLQNSVTPRQPHLNDSDEIATLHYFKQIKNILSILGYPVFEKTPEEKQVKNIYLFEDVKNKDGSGKGALLPSSEFIVFAGSKARIQETPSFKGSGPRLRQKLIEEGVYKKLDDKSYIFTRDYIFRTPSAAGDAVAGRSTNGWTAWKDEKGNTLDENLRK